MATENNTTTALFKRLQKNNNIQLRIQFKKLRNANLDMFRNHEVSQILKNTFHILDSNYETSETIITLKGKVGFKYRPGSGYHIIETNIQYHQSPLIFTVFYWDIERGSLKMNDSNNNVVPSRGGYHKTTKKLSSKKVKSKKSGSKKARN